MSRDEPFYNTWDDTKKSKEAAFNNLGDVFDVEYDSAKANARLRNFSDLTSTLSGRPGLTNKDYDYFRQSEAVPTKDKEIIAFCRKAYESIGLIRNSIDLMADFACQGIRMSHKNEKIEKFIIAWFKRVKGKEVSERFCNLLLREANLVIQMRTGKISTKKREEMQRSIAADMDVYSENVYFKSKEIPWRYNFIDPILVDPVGGALSSLVDHKIYSVDMSNHQLDHLRTFMKNSPKALEKVFSQLPEEIVRSIKEKKKVELNPDKTYVVHYKKDDWNSWAKPIVYACAKDLILYNKLKLADQTALDGATNKVRVWKIGNFEYKMAPTQASASLLKSILGTSTGAGTTDIIWGPDIELIETNSDTSTFLGDEKYKPTLMSIYSCLGIPPTLTGTYGASGTTNNFMSLKTLTERLNYIRDKLVEFWTTQLNHLQKAMGFRFPAEIEFDFMSMDDPAATTRLLIEMCDRNIISEEFLQRHIKAKPVLENRRLRKESKKEKVGPFHPVDKDFQYKKILTQMGEITPNELGIELEEKGDQQTMNEKNMEADKSKEKSDDFTNKPNGRPPGTTDTVPRKTKKFNPVTKANIELWSKKTQDQISTFLNPSLLKHYGKKNMRSLSSKQASEAESIKFNVLFNLKPLYEVDGESIAEALDKPVPKEIHEELDNWFINCTASAGRTLSSEESRHIMASFNAYFKCFE